MTKLIVLAAALCLSCSDPQYIYCSENSPKTRVCCSIYTSDRDFANWVKKAHPDIWIEYYSTAIGDTL